MLKNYKLIEDYLAIARSQELCIVLSELVGKLTH